MRVKHDAEAELMLSCCTSLELSRGHLAYRFEDATNKTSTFDAVLGCLSHKCTRTTFDTEATPAPEDASSGPFKLTYV